MPEYKLIVDENGIKICNQSGIEVDPGAITVLMNMLDDSYPQPAWVYLLQNFDGWSYKIGLTTQSDNKRLSQIRSDEKGRHIHLIHKIPCDCLEKARDLEKALHKHFASRRAKGEWFNLSFEEAQLIEGMSDFEDAVTKLYTHPEWSQQKYKRRMYTRIFRNLQALEGYFPEMRVDLRRCRDAISDWVIIHRPAYVSKISPQFRDSVVKYLRGE